MELWVITTTNGQKNWRIGVITVITVTYRGYNPHLYTTSRGPPCSSFLVFGCNHSIGQRYLHYFIDENFRFQKSQGLQGHSGSSLSHYFIESQGLQGHPGSKNQLFQQDRQRYLSQVIQSDPDWWFQPTWKILVKLGIFPKLGWK